MSELADAFHLEIGAFALTEFLRYYELLDRLGDFQVESVIAVGHELSAEEWMVTITLRQFPSEWGSWSAEVSRVPNGKLTTSHLYAFDEETPFVDAILWHELPSAIRWFLQQSKSDVILIDP